MPAPVLEATEATNTAIKDRMVYGRPLTYSLVLPFCPRKECLDEGCSVDALMELDKKLAKDEELRGEERGKLELAVGIHSRPIKVLST